MEVQFSTKTILKSEGLQFNSQSMKSKNGIKVVVFAKRKTRFLPFALIDKKKNSIEYNWENINRLKLGTIDNLLHRIDCIVKNKKPNP